MNKEKQDLLKKKAAQKAIEWVQPGMIVGVGTGSTVAFFIEELAKIKHDIEGAVSSSEDSTQKLKAAGIPVYELNSVGDIPLYVDGALKILSKVVERLLLEKKLSPKPPKHLSV